jgi:sugar diacid utilization regulator
VERAPEVVLADAYYRVAELFAQQIDDLVVQITDVQRFELPQYQTLPRELLEQETREMLGIAARQLLRGRSIDDEARAEVVPLVRGWARSALPPSAIAQSFQLAAHQIVLRKRAIVRSLRLPSDVEDALHDFAWRWTMLSAAALAEAQRDGAVAAARRDAAHRSDFLRDLAAGHVTSSRLHDEAERLGLDLEIDYVAVVAPVVEATAASGIESALRSSGSTAEHRAVSAVLDGQLIAIAPRRPRVPDGAVVAVGQARPVAELRPSITEARQLLHVARCFGLTGLIDLEATGPLTMVAFAGETARRLADHHFAGLGDEFRDVERTVLALLERDHSVAGLAADMHVHRNTVRYRVARFRELTGLDVRRTRDLVTAWWLLTWRESQRSPDERAARGPR